MLQRTIGETDCSPVATSPEGSVSNPSPFRSLIVWEMTESGDHPVDSLIRFESLSLSKGRFPTFTGVEVTTNIQYVRVSLFVRS